TPERPAPRAGRARRAARGTARSGAPDRSRGAAAADGRRRSAGPRGRCRGPSVGRSWARRIIPRMRYHRRGQRHRVGGRDLGVLSADQNRTLTEVGAGTPRGAAPPLYWMPSPGGAELDATPTKAVRLLGEDLVLYRDKRGTYGLLGRHCPHRRADLSYGFVEECGLRCHYHGWLYDERGRCLAQPYEEIAHPEARYKDRITVKSYPVEAKAGMLWAYLGPQPAPLVPTWEPFTWKNGFVQVVISEIPCNWFQCQENSIDP